MVTRIHRAVTVETATLDVAFSGPLLMSAEQWEELKAELDQQEQEQEQEQERYATALSMPERIFGGRDGLGLAVDLVAVGFLGAQLVSDYDRRACLRELLFLLKYECWPIDLAVASCVKLACSLADDDPRLKYLSAILAAFGYRAHALALKNRSTLREVFLTDLLEHLELYWDDKPLDPKRVLSATIDYLVLDSRRL